ncbi:MAG TPA: CvpA family protein [Stellaceae bacterium]|nr:CvpA family protein [Stellaceae bacterium]
MNPFDIIVIAIVVLSGLFAFARGFVKEALSVAAWLGAAVATLYALPYAQPLAERLLPKGMIADVTAGVVIFVIVLIVLSLLTSAISRRVKESSLSALDRSLGLIFGLARGAVLACLLYLGVTWALPEQSRPQWIQQARTLPLLSSGADVLRSLVPPSMRSRVQATASEAQQKMEQAHQAEDAIRALQLPRPAAQQPAAADSGQQKGYSEDQRRDLNRLFQQNSQ